SRNATLVPVDGGTPRPISGLGPDEVPFQWTDDGKAAYVLLKRSPVQQVDLLDLTTGHRTPWRELGRSDVGGRARYARNPPLVSRNGQAWAYSLYVGQSGLYLVSMPTL